MGKANPTGSDTLAKDSPAKGLARHQDPRARAIEHAEKQRSRVARQVGTMTRGRRLGGYFWTWHSPDQRDKPNWSFQEQRKSGVLADGQWAAPPSWPV